MGAALSGISRWGGKGDVPLTGFALALVALKTDSPLRGRLSEGGVRLDMDLPIRPVLRCDERDLRASSWASFPQSLVLCPHRGPFVASVSPRCVWGAFIPAPPTPRQAGGFPPMRSTPPGGSSDAPPTFGFHLSLTSSFGLRPHFVVRSGYTLSPSSRHCYSSNNPKTRPTHHGEVARSGFSMGVLAPYPQKLACVDLFPCRMWCLSAGKGRMTRSVVSQ
jgi:hypothetical protein